MAARPNLPPSPSAAGTPSTGLTSLPGHLLDNLTEHLTLTERGRLGTVPSRHLSASIAPQVHAARIQHAAPAIGSLAAFVHALNGEGEGITGRAAVAPLPPRLQRAPLIALGSRILALPEPERGGAAAAWMAFPFVGSPDALLNDLRGAAAHGADGLDRREGELVGEWGEAYVDVLRGLNVQQVAQARAISGPQSIEILDLEAVRVIGENLTAHDILPTLWQRVGVTSDAASEELQETAARRVGSAAVQGGLAVADVVQRMGITWPPAIRLLNVEGARRDVALGGHVEHVARTYGVGDIRVQLEQHAATTAARRMALSGATPAEIVQHLGIRSLAAVAQIDANAAPAASPAQTQDRQETALVSQGGQAYQDVMAGGNVQEVSQRLGVTTPARVGYLEFQAVTRIQSTYRASDHLPTLMAEAGVTNPHWIQHLQQVASDGPGTSAVHRGAEPAAVAARMGITAPAALHTLDLAAAEGDIALGLNAQVAMHDRHITAADERQGLELWALASGGQRALDAGEPVGRIAQRLGIRLPDVLRALEHQAIATVGMNALYNGEEPEQIAVRLEIRDPRARHTLDLVTAQRDIEWGGNAQEVMRGRNITDVQERRDLERWAVATNGQRALEFGEPMTRIVQRFGIQDPQALQDLQQRRQLVQEPPENLE